MNFKSITEAAGQFASRSLLQTKKYSPEILTILGVAGLVTAGVLAARATLKLEDTVDDAHNEVNWAKQAIELGDKTNADLKKVYVKNAVSLVKLYGPSVTLATVSVVCILGAHGILRQRNVALLAAYKGLETAYSNYRQRVVDEFGADKDLEYYHGVKTEMVANEETGKKTKTQELVAAGSEYVFEFGPGNQNWVGFHDDNLFFLKMQQNNANDRLRAHGHIFLNDVLASIGLPDTKAGAVTGWVWNPRENFGDNFVDFGVDYYSSIRAGAVENGLEGVIRLDFNVDGVILDLI